MPELYLLFIFLSFLLFTGMKLFSLWIRKPKHAPLALNEVTVIIPFRNEADNLPILLQSIFQQACLSKEILFVNDHSEDNSAALVEAFIDERRIGKLLNLSHDKRGKKNALNLGIRNASTQFILTIDADVVLPEDYLVSLQQISAYGLSSLPVIMKGNSFLSKLISTEYSFFNAFNYLLSSIWPISISGANLLFDVKAVDYHNELKVHQHLASGDDYFLLRAFRKNTIPIHIINEPRLCVKTDAPTSLKSYLDQRVRWLGKSKFQINWIDTLIGVFIVMYFIGGLAALLTSLFLSQWMLLISIFVLRFLVDALVYLNYAQKLGITRNVFILPFFQLLYPFMFLTVAILSLFYKPSWKGRTLDQHFY